MTNNFGNQKNGALERQKGCTFDNQQEGHNKDDKLIAVSALRCAVGAGKT